MKTQNKANLNNNLDKPKNKRLRGLNYQSHQAFLKLLEDYHSIITYFRVEYRIEYTAIEMLIFLYLHYYNTGLPISINSLTLKCKSASWYAVKQRLLRMENKGLVIKTYNPHSTYYVFEPSPVVISFFEGIEHVPISYFAQTA